MFALRYLEDVESESSLHDQCLMCGIRRRWSLEDPNEAMSAGDETEPDAWTNRKRCYWSERGGVCLGGFYFALLQIVSCVKL